jgi:hypothetical protein
MTVTECKRVRLSGTVQIPLPPEGAFGVFTPEGMRAWRPSWEPQYPAPEADTTEPGTVFDTEHDSHVTTWIVVRCEPGQPLLYARVKPDKRAGLVTITLERQPDDTTEATIDYDLTTLVPEGNAELDEYAAQYQQMLGHWQQLIAHEIAESYVPA